ncbi:MAG TPA: lysophospholipid acyltransferase family protein [Paracoccaceae bacterium]|nr:lysophospholipid acyltransferase family protein [Paracoccaceae bacterium]
MIWDNGIRPDFERPGFFDWVRFISRAVFFVVGTVVLISMFFIGKVLEYPFGHRFLTTPIVRAWGAMGLLASGLRLEVTGTPMNHGGALVANHASWLDIFVMHAAAKIFFVAKSEVRSWPGIGFLARVTGTMFIERRATEAKRQQMLLLARMQRGHRLCFFPEGTSTDGRRVLDFKSTLFAAFHTPELIEHVWVQPATITYIAPKGREATFYGWWGDMSFGEHVFAVLALSRGGKVHVTLHEPVPAADFANRKTMAAYATDIVRVQLAENIGVPVSEAGS